jgi:protein translocase SEC61 complex gamma subunit
MKLWDDAVYVMRVSRKPSTEEVSDHLKIVLAGMFAMGIIGFVIYLLFKFIMPA